MDHQALAQLLGNYGEFVGAIAVVVTLGYLTVQIRQNTAGTNSNNNHNVMEGFNSFNQTLFSDPDLVAIYYRGMAEPDELTDGEQKQFVHMTACLMNLYRNLYQQFLDKTFPEQQWLVQAREAKQLLETPGGTYFRTITASYDLLFEYLDRLPADGSRPLSEKLFPLALS